MIEAAFGKPHRFPGFKIRHKNGVKSDCRLVNLTFAPRDRFSAFTMEGANFAKSQPPGFVPVEV
jgi:hypothetical protein